jgi:hypothetical protein
MASSERVGKRKRVVYRSSPEPEEEEEEPCLCDDADYWWEQDEEGKSYEVEEILAERYCKHKDEVRYLTKWEEYDIKRATWEPEEHFGGNTVADWKEKKLRQERGEETPFDLKEWREYRDRVWQQDLAAAKAADKKERKQAKAARKRSRPADLDFNNDSSSSSEAEEGREIVEDYEGIVQRSTKRPHDITTGRPRQDDDRPQLSDSDSEDRPLAKKRFLGTARQAQRAGESTSSLKRAVAKATSRATVGSTGYQGTANRAAKAHRAANPGDPSTKATRGASSARRGRPAAARPVSQPRRRTTLEDRLLGKVDVPADVRDSAKPFNWKSTEWRVQKASRNLADRAPTQMPTLFAPGSLKIGKKKNPAMKATNALQANWNPFNERGRVNAENAQSSIEPAAIYSAGVEANSATGVQTGAPPSDSMDMDYLFQASQEGSSGAWNVDDGDTNVIHHDDSRPDQDTVMSGVSPDIGQTDGAVSSVLAKPPVKKVSFTDYAKAKAAPAPMLPGAGDQPQSEMTSTSGPSNESSTPAVAAVEGLHPDRIALLLAQDDMLDADKDDDHVFSPASAMQPSGSGSSNPWIPNAPYTAFHKGSVGGINPNSIPVASRLDILSPKLNTAQLPPRPSQSIPPPSPLPQSIPLPPPPPPPPAPGEPRTSDPRLRKVDSGTTQLPIHPTQADAPTPTESRRDSATEYSPTDQLQASMAQAQLGGLPDRKVSFSSLSIPKQSPMSPPPRHTVISPAEMSSVTSPREPGEIVASPNLHSVLSPEERSSTVTSLQEQPGAGPRPVGGAILLTPSLLREHAYEAYQLIKYFMDKPPVWKLVTPYNLLDTLSDLCTQKITARGDLQITGEKTPEKEFELADAQWLLDFELGCYEFAHDKLRKLMTHGPPLPFGVHWQDAPKRSNCPRAVVYAPKAVGENEQKLVEWFVQWKTGRPEIKEGYICGVLNDDIKSGKYLPAKFNPDFDSKRVALHQKFGRRGSITNPGAQGSPAGDVASPGQVKLHGPLPKSISDVSTAYKICRRFEEKLSNNGVALDKIKVYSWFQAKKELGLGKKLQQQKPPPPQPQPQPQVQAPMHQQPHGQAQQKVST